MNTGVHMVGFANSNKLKTFHALSLLLLLFAFVSPVAAQVKQESGADAPAEKQEEAKKEKENTDVIRTGVIANSGEYASGNAVNVDTQGAAPGDESSTIQGSVSQVGRGMCKATVTNSSEENTYHVRFRVVGTSENGVAAVKKTFSATLKPSETENRELKCKDNYRMQVVLLSARKR